MPQYSQIKDFKIRTVPRSEINAFYLIIELRRKK